MATAVFAHFGQLSVNHDHEPIGGDLRLVSDHAVIQLQRRQCSSASSTSVALELKHGEYWIDRLAILVQLDPCASTGIIRTVRNSAPGEREGCEMSNIDQTCEPY